MTVQQRVLRQVGIDMVFFVVAFPVLAVILTHRWPQWWYYLAIVFIAAVRYFTLSRRYAKDARS